MGRGGRSLVARRHATAASFLAAAEGYLLAREAEHCLLLGICAGLPAGSLDGGGPWLATAQVDATMVGVALHWGPFDVVLSHLDDPAAADALCDLLLDSGHAAPGVSGTPEHAGRFADRWVSRRGGTHRLRSSERVHRLRRVLPSAPAPGRPRRATGADLAVLRRWMVGFHRDALGLELDDPDGTVRSWLSSDDRALDLWECDDGPVSMTGTQGRTPSGVRLSAVYTPPERRRHGYATSLVAAVSQAQLDAGRRECYIYTDLANPTSNHIYAAVGYEPIADVVHLRFLRDGPG